MAQSSPNWAVVTGALAALGVLALARRRRSRELSDWLTAAVGHVDYTRFYATSEASMRTAAACIPRPDDVFIATYSKTGTTVMQMLVEMLRSRGDTDFEEITQVQPWLDF